MVSRQDIYVLQLKTPQYRSHVYGYYYESTIISSYNTKKIIYKHKKIYVDRVLTKIGYRKHQRRLINKVLNMMDKEIDYTIHTHALQVAQFHSLSREVRLQLKDVMQAQMNKYQL